MNQVSSKFSTNFSGSMNNLKVLHLNIRSLRKNFSDFLTYLHTIPFPDIIVLSEIWIYESEIDMFSINNYTHYFSCNNDSRSGGIGVYVHNDHCAISACSLPNMHCNNLFMKIRTQSRDEIHLLSIYRSPSSNEDSFISNLEQFL